MSSNVPKWWSKRRAFMACIGIVLAIIVALLAIDPFTTPAEKINEQIDQKNYSRVVRLFDKEIAETDHEEEYRETILTIITETIIAWENEELPYEKAKAILECFACSEDLQIADVCKAQLFYIAVENEGERLLKEAQVSLVTGNYVEALEAIITVDPSFTQYKTVQALTETCKDRILMSVSAPDVEEDFRSYISFLDDCFAVFPSESFISRRIQLEEELEIFLAVSEIIDRATSLYDESLVEESLLTLTFGLLDYPNNERLNTSLVDFSDHYIITITKQAAELCEAEEYKAALDLVESALEEFECDEFYLLEESIKEQKSVLYKFKNDLVRYFEIMAPGWDKELFDVQQAAGDAGAYIVKSGKKLVLGDYSKENVTILSFGGNIVASLAGVDFLFDLRDVSYDITHWGEEEYFAFYLAADVIALLPIVGVIKYFQHIEDIGDGIKATADVVDSVADVNKASDNAVDAVNTMADAAKNADNFSDTIDNIKDTTKLGQTAKEVITKVTKGYEPISTINNRYLNSTHPDTGVEFKQAFISYSNGQKIVGVFPKFDSAADVQLPEGLYKASFLQQEKYCIEQLQKQLKNPFSGTKRNFSDAEIEQIMDNKIPNGYTWHHNQKEGLMQIVSREIHEATRHTGGMSLWGVGY